MQWRVKPPKFPSIAMKQSFHSNPILLYGKIGFALCIKPGWMFKHKCRKHTAKNIYIYWILNLTCFWEKINWNLCMRICNRWKSRPKEHWNQMLLLSFTALHHDKRTALVLKEDDDQSERRVTQHWQRNTSKVQTVTLTSPVFKCAAILPPSLRQLVNKYTLDLSKRRKQTQRPKKEWLERNERMASGVTLQLHSSSNHFWAALKCEQVGHSVGCNYKSLNQQAAVGKCVCVFVRALQLS